VIGRAWARAAVRVTLAVSGLVLTTVVGPAKAGPQVPKAGSGALVPAAPQSPVSDAGAPDNRHAGLQWRFVRIKYHYTIEGTQQSYDFAGEPWFIDGPAAEQNLARRVKTATAIQVEDPIVLSLDDPRLFESPWIYFVEPGTLKLLETEVPILREFFLRGGTAMFDDFHGPLEWDNFEHEIKRVFPNRPIVDVPKDHPVFSCFYKIEAYPQVPGIGSFTEGRTWEKGGFVPHHPGSCADATRSRPSPRSARREMSRSRRPAGSRRSCRTR